MIHALLIDQFAVATRMRNCRWNVTGPQGLRALFLSHDRSLGEMLDDLAGLARVAGNRQTSVLAVFLKDARMRTQPGESPRGSEIISEVLAGHEVVIRRLRESLEPFTPVLCEGITPVVLVGLLEMHQKMADELRTAAEELDRPGERVGKQQQPCGFI